MSRLFEARWNGRCPLCGEEWEPGDTIGYDDGELVCEGCHADPFGDFDEDR